MSDEKASCDKTVVREEGTSVLTPFEKWKNELNELRSELDWSWHLTETEQEKLDHNEFIISFLEKFSLTPVDHPIILFLGGCFGSGKSHTIRKWESGHFLSNSLLNDPDYIKLSYHKTDIEEKGTSVLTLSQTKSVCSHKEACLMSELITRFCLHHRYHVIVDGSLQDSEWHILFFQYIRQQHPSYAIHLLWVRVSDFATIQKRVEKRTLQTGRKVDPDVLKKVWEQVPKSIAHLRPHVDLYAELLNDDEK
jgi:hypothetical protein